MKKTIVVPTYWSRPSSQHWQKGDLVFDHPTPLDQDGTLGRFLDSCQVLDGDYQLALVVVPTAAEIMQDVVDRVKRIVEQSRCPVTVKLFTPDCLKEISDSMKDIEGKYNDLLDLGGYAQVRNGCLLAAALTGAEAAVLIDDDEIFQLPDFLEKVEDGLARTHEGSKVECLAGYYLNPDGDYLLKKELPEWAEDWPKYQVMDEGFKQFIAEKPRYKKTPFVFGGNLSIRNSVFTRIPFDTSVTRGEDIDYLMMCMMSGIPTILDNELHIMHKAPPKSHPEWQQFRQDIIRFGYQRSKLSLLTQKNYEGLSTITSEDMDPYPGFFLKDDLDARVKKTCENLAVYYKKAGDEEGVKQSRANMEYFNQAASPVADPLERFLDQRQRWQEIMDHIANNELHDVLE